MAVAILDVVQQLLDNSGELLAGGLVYSYAGGTSTPLATYADATGLIANANPLVLDSSGRGDVWFTTGVSYKVVIKTAAGVTLHTVDAIVAPGSTATATTAYLPLDFLFHGTSPPIVSEWLGGYSFTVAVTFPANFAGAFGHINTNPTASFAISLRKNATTSATGTAVGTVTIAAGGTFTFATTSGATKAFAIGDHISAWGPGTADATANDFNFTLLGTLT